MPLPENAFRWNGGCVGTLTGSRMVGPQVVDGLKIAANEIAVGHRDDRLRRREH